MNCVLARMYVYPVMNLSLVTFYRFCVCFFNLIVNSNQVWPRKKLIIRFVFGYCVFICVQCIPYVRYYIVEMEIVLITEGKISSPHSP